MKFHTKFINSITLLFILLSNSFQPVRAQSNDPNISFKNNTGAKICSIFFSDPKDKVWIFVSELIGEETKNSLKQPLEPGLTAKFKMQPGLFTVLVRDCEDNLVYFQTVQVNKSTIIDLEPIDSSLSISNLSGEEICTISISDANNPFYSGNWLGDRTLSPGRGAKILLSEGNYSVTVFSCKNKIGTIYEVPQDIIYNNDLHISGDVEISISPRESLLKVNNFAAKPICGVYIKQDNSDSIYNLLSSEVVKVIWGGFSREFNLSGGKYNVWIMDCQENIILQKEDVDLSGVSDVDVTDDEEEYYRLFNNGWDHYTWDGDLELAHNSFKSALAIATKSQNLSEQESLLWYLGEIAEKLGANEQAIEYNKQLLDLSRKINDDSSELRALERISKSYMVLADYQQAIKTIEDYLTITKARRLTKNEGLAYLQLGDIYLAKGDYNNALLIYQKVKTMNIVSAETYQRFGRLWGEQGYFQKALDNLLTAKNLEKYAVNKDFTAEIDRDLGVVYLNLRSFGLAYGYLLSSYEAYSKDNNLSEVNQVAFYLGKMSYEMGEINDANQYFTSSLDFFRKSENKLMLDEILIDLGKTKYQEKNFAEAKSYYSEAIKIEQENGYSRNHALTLFYLGKIETTQQNYGKAIKYFQESQDLFNELGIYRYSPSVLYAIGKAFENNNQPDDAINAYKKAIDYVNDFSYSLLPVELKTLYIKDFENLYTDLGNLLIERNEPENAFYYLEMNKARSLKDLLAGAEYSYNTPDFTDTISINPIINSFNIQRADIYLLRKNIFDISQSDEENYEKLPELRDQLTFLQYSQQELLSEMSIQNSYRDSNKSQVYLTLADVQSSLNGDTTLLEYFFFKNQLLIYIVEKDNLNIQIVNVDEAEVRNAIKNSYSYNDFDSSLENGTNPLYSYLITPIEKYLHNKKLIIVPQGQLFYIPFAALKSNDGYLIDKFEISVIPSVNFIIKDGVQKKSGNAALFVGDPEIFEPFLPVLMQSREEVENISKIYNTEAITGKKATELFVTENIAKSRIIHIASHALLNKDNPLFSSILLGIDKENGWESIRHWEDSNFLTNEESISSSATVPIHQNDGYLEVHEIYSLDLSNTDMVVLSGCQTSFSDVAEGDEIIGLSGAFLSNDVPVVVSSLWVVNDATTAFLMEDFYKNLHDGKTAADSLRLAQIKTSKKFPNPFYWAGFVLMGNGNLTIDFKNATLPSNKSIIESLNLNWK